MITLYKYLKGSCMKKGEKSDACTSRGSDVTDRRREQFPKGARRAVTAWWAESRTACPEPARGFQPWPGPEQGGLGRSSLLQAAREAFMALTWDGHGCTAWGVGVAPCPADTSCVPCTHQSCVSTGRSSAGAVPAGSGHSLGSTELPHGSQWPGRASLLPFPLLSQLSKGCLRTKASKPLILSSTAHPEPPRKISASG